MRVVFWSELFRPDIGGIEVFGEQLMRRLRARGFEFCVVTSRRGLLAPEADHFDGMEVRRYPFHVPLMTHDLPGARRLVDQVLEFLRAWKPDLIHLNTVGPSLFYVERCLKRLSIPTLLTVHSHTLEPPDAKTLLARVLGQCTQVNAVSRDTLNGVLGHCPDFAGKCSVILNGLEQIEEAPAPLPFHPPVFLGIGRLVAVKGFDTAIDAFALLRARCPKARLLIAGDGSERDALEAQAARLGLGASVAFLGWVAPEDVPALMNQATAVVMPSCYREPFGLVAVQAGQMQRPLVGTLAGALPEIVRNGETGFLVPQRDPEALAGALLRVLEDPARSESMGVAARKHVLESFGIARMTCSYEDLYHQAVSYTEGRGT